MAIENQILKLETQLTEMSHTLSELKEQVQKTQTEEIKIDIEKTEKYARQKKFAGHLIEHMEKQLAYKYCVLLAGAMELISHHHEKRLRQYYFLSRIFSLKEKRTFLETMMRDAKMISLSDMEMLKEELSEEQQDMFLIDLLLMISFDGDMDSKQLEYFMEMAEFFCISQEKMEEFAHLVKAVLAEDLDVFYSAAEKFPIKYIDCYMRERLGGVIVYDRETLEYALEHTQEKKIFVCGIRFQEDNLRFGQCKQEFIVFVGCRFTCKKIYIKVETELHRCNFIDCEKVDIFNLGKIKNCIFTKTKYETTLGSDKNMIHIFDGSVEKTVFEGFKICMSGTRKNIVMPIASLLTGKREETEQVEKCSASILHISNGIIKDCCFKKCQVIQQQRAVQKDYTSIIRCTDGAKVQNTKFMECECHGSRHDFIIAADDATTDNNKFIDCKADRNIGTVGAGW